MEANVSDTLQVLVCGPVIGRVNIREFSLILNLLAHTLSKINPKNGVHVQTYEKDAAELVKFLEIKDSLSLSFSTDPGPDYNFPSKKGFENTSRMFRLGVEGLKNLSADICCKTRAELVPDIDNIQKFISQITITTTNLKARGMDSIAIIPEHYGGPLAYKKGTLCSISDTFIIANTRFMREVFSMAENIWLDYKKSSPSTPNYPLVNEQFLGRAYYEKVAGCNTSNLKMKFDFQFDKLLVGRSLEKNKILFVPYWLFGFTLGRFSNTSNSLVSNKSITLNRIPVARRIIDILFLLYRLRNLIHNSFRNQYIDPSGF